MLAQKDGDKEDPTTDEIYHIGTVAKIVKQIKMPDGNTTIFIMGRMRFKVEEFTQTEPYFTARVNYMEDHFPKDDPEFIALVASLKDQSEQIAQLSPNLPNETSIVLRNIEHQSFLIHFISSNISAKLVEKQMLLEEDDVRRRAEKLLQLLQSELQLLEPSKSLLK